MKLLLTFGIYSLILAMIYAGVANFEHDEVEGNASLICYACIGVN